MNFLLLIHEPHGQRAERTLEQGRQAYGQMLGFAEELKTQGKLRAVESLAGDERGVRVQVRQGRTRAVDGPFTEAKEMVGGFFLIDCADMDEAKALAQRCPAAAWATVEVRPVGPCFM
jgi:hypothetical protein